MKKGFFVSLCFLFLTAPVHAKYNKMHDGGHQGLPPGLQKKVMRGKQLPPGWRKKLVKGHILEEILLPHLVLVPKDVLPLLPPLPPGVSYKRIEDKILKIHDINMQILEVLELDKFLPPLPR